MAMSNRQATINGLLQLGFRRNYLRDTRKYEVYMLEDARANAVGMQFLIGKQGALRLCRVGSSIAESKSLTDMPVHKALQYVGRSGDLLTRERARELFTEEHRRLRGVAAGRAPAAALDE